jgi:STAS domain-containing protein
MPGCTLEREVIGTTALYRISGKFEGACAWELSGRLEREPLSSVVVDFAQVGEFVDYGIAVMANAVQSADKQIKLRGLRQHQERLFRYFGVDAAESPADGSDLPLQGTALQSVAPEVV